MARYKHWRVAFEGKRFRLEDAEFVLNDFDSYGGGYNHPRLILDFTQEGWTPAYEGDGAGRRTVVIIWQRNRPSPNDLTPFRPAQYRMDTAKQWSTSYAGKIELDYDSSEIRLVDQPFKLHHKSRFANQVARIIARTIREYNLHRGEEDEATQVVAAVEKLADTSVQFIYEDRLAKVPLHSVGYEKLGANARAFREARDAREAKEREESAQ